MSEFIIWILGAPGETFGQHILDLGGLRDASGPFWNRSGDDLGSKLDANKEIVDFLNSMLSRTWEHGFSMVWGWIWGGFYWFGMVLECL